jgi:hypothetical protein
MLASLPLEQNISSEIWTLGAWSRDQVDCVPQMPYLMASPIAPVLHQNSVTPVIFDSSHHKTASFCPLLSYDTALPVEHVWNPIRAFDASDCGSTIAKLPRREPSVGARNTVDSMESQVFYADNAGYNGLIRCYISCGSFLCFTWLGPYGDHANGVWIILILSKLVAWDCHHICPSDTHCYIHSRSVSDEVRNALTRLTSAVSQHEY